MQFNACNITCNNTYGITSNNACVATYCSAHVMWKISVITCNNTRIVTCVFTYNSACSITCNNTHVGLYVTHVLLHVTIDVLLDVIPYALSHWVIHMSFTCNTAFIIYYI